LFEAKELKAAVSRMISRSGVCGLNFTKRSSFSTSGLWRHWLRPKGTTDNSPQFQLRVSANKQIKPRRGG
jgi:hypothetical protein